MRENKYRTQYCGKISESDIGNRVRLAGWVENIRDHGGVIFVDIRDQYGVIQIVSNDNNIFNGLTRESTVTIEGIVRKRDEETVNPRLQTGTVEVLIDKFEIISKANNELPFEIKKMIIQNKRC